MGGDVRGRRDTASSQSAGLLLDGGGAIYSNEIGSLIA